jgi:RNA polymerase sigma-70 factor (ECF subfamily)
LNEEQALVERLARGEMSAFQELVEQNKKKVYYLALDIVGNHHDAEDISQEVFLKVFRSFQTFKRDAKLSSWLYRITVNASIDHLRKKSAVPERMQDEFLEEHLQHNPAGSLEFAGDPERSAETRLIQEHIESALQKISAQERSAFVLRHYHDLMIKDIAEVMNVSVGTVKSYLFRGIKKLQRELAIYRMPSGLEVNHD